MISLTSLHESKSGRPVSDLGCARVLAVGTGEGASLGHLFVGGEGGEKRRVFVRCCRGSMDVDGEKLKVGDAFLWRPGASVRVDGPPLQAIAVVAPVRDPAGEGAAMVASLGSEAARAAGAAEPSGAEPPAAPGADVFRRGSRPADLLDDVAVAWLSGDDAVLEPRVREFLRCMDGAAAPSRHVARRGVAYGAREAMGTSISEPLTIPELAEACSTSPTVLKEAFRDEFGLPVYEWYRRLRMLRASEILGASAAAVAGVAAEVGYANASKFARAFTDCMGVSPSAYRAV